MGFEHSIKVPTQYKKAAKTLKKCMEEDVSVKHVIYSQVKHADINKLYALIGKIMANQGLLTRIIEDSKLFELEPRLDPYLGRILVAELLIGKQQLNGKSKPVESVLKYEPKLRELYQTATETSGGAVSVQPVKVNNPRYVRLNTLTLKRDQFLEQVAEEGWWLQPTADSYEGYLEQVADLANDHFTEDFHIPNLFTFPKNSKRYWATHGLVKSSQVLLQDKSSCLAPFLLNPAKKSVTLDMCSAPGLKTIFLAAMIKNRGRIYAVEKMRMRFETLRSFVETSNSVSVQPIEADVLRIKKEDVPDVEYILLDPSCSGSGIVQRFEDTSTPGPDGEEATSDRIEKLSRLQLKMLLHAMNEFPSVKRIVYSTCSINAEENEAVVQKALKQCTKFKLVQPESLAEWKNFGASSYKKVGKKCVYCRPDIDLTNGFFIAVLEKKAEEGVVDDVIEIE